MISEEELRRAAIEWEKARLQSLPEPEACGNTFSPGFERKIKKLIQRTDHPAKYWLKRSLACVLLVGLLGGGVLTFHSGARAAFWGWTIEMVDSFFTYRYKGPSFSPSQNVTYSPTWTPDGFQELSQDASGTGKSIVYQDQNGKKIIFCYALNSEGFLLGIGSENTTVQRTFVGEHSADLYLAQNEGEANTIVWTDEAKGYIFWTAGLVSGDDLIAIAESVQSETS